MPEIDPTFTALPYRELGDAALARARELGAEPRRLPLRADPLPAPRRPRRRAPGRAATPRTSASRSGSSTAARGGSPPAWCSPPTRRVRVAETAVAVAEVAAEMTSAPGRARARAGLRRRHLGLVVRRQPVRGADRREGRPAHRLDRPAARRARPSTTPRPSSQQVQENKYYADLAGTRTTQQRVRMQPDVRGDGRRRGHLRLDARASRRRSAAAGSTSPTAARLRLGRRARRDPRAARREAQGAQRRGRQLRPGHPPVQPVAHHPRVDRPRHRARPGARLRGQLRRHVVRDATTSSTPCSTARAS